ncbi:3-isopropylmalate dehydratase small subunit [Buchnera aphidicola]|uniref:3-isopropylmalate dehydratase small subunit n=1 Tax=Buchnera aphidicola TaxID=9 RepID=UPI003D189214
MKNKIVKHTGKVIPLDISNVDTDVIIPKQFLQRVTKNGFGFNLFHNWRFHDEKGEKINKNFILNKNEYKNSTILLCRDNFGCGSSREHAVWALKDYGFLIVIATSFADIFYNNSINNNLLPICFNKNIINNMFNIVKKNIGIKFTVNLHKKSVTNIYQKYNFDIDETVKQRLIQGIDNIDLTMKIKKKIKQYESKIPKFFLNLF